MSKLLVLGCSMRKRRFSSSKVKAIELYDGPNFRVVRAALSAWPHLAQQIDLFVVSARWEIISSDAQIEGYDCSLTDLAEEEYYSLHENVVAQWREIVDRKKYSSIFLGLPENYLELLGDWQSKIAPATALYIARGAPGQNAAALKEWLNESTESPGAIWNGMTGKQSPRVAGREFNFSERQIRRCILAYHDNLPVAARRFHSRYVDVEGQRIAPKWLVSELTGVPVSRFNSEQACRALSAWGTAIYTCSALSNCLVERVEEKSEK